MRLKLNVHNVLFNKPSYNSLRRTNKEMKNLKKAAAKLQFLRFLMYLRTEQVHEMNIDFEELAIKLNKYLIFQLLLLESRY